jgi:hypothetical protein
MDSDTAALIDLAKRWSMTVDTRRRAVEEVTQQAELD